MHLLIFLTGELKFSFKVQREHVNKVHLLQYYKN